MTIDELIATMMRLSEEAPRRSVTEVMLRNEGYMEIEGVSLGRAQLPCGRWIRSQVVIIQAGTAPRPTIRMSEERDLPIEGSEDQA